MFNQQKLRQIAKIMSELSSLMQINNFMQVMVKSAGTLKNELLTRLPNTFGA